MADQKASQPDVLSELDSVKSAGSGFTNDQIAELAKALESQAKRLNIGKWSEVCAGCAAALRAWLSERESAKLDPVAFITPESLAKLQECDVMAVAAIQNWADGEFCIAVHTDNKSVAPMLASARVPERTSDMTQFVDGLGWVVRLSDVPEYTKRLIEQMRDLLAAATKLETSHVAC